MLDPEERIRPTPDREKYQGTEANGNPNGVSDPAESQTQQGTVETWTESQIWPDIVETQAESQQGTVVTQIGLPIKQASMGIQMGPQ
ncbi:unnamed protein product [Caretta caretta]